MATEFGVYSSLGSEYKSRQQYVKHLRALKRAKTKLDNKDPTDVRYLMRVKRKRQQFVDHHQYKVDSQNEALLERLLDIRNSSGQVDNWNNSYKPKFDKNKAYRRRIREKIDIDNKKLLKRLQTCKPFYNKTEWDKSYVKHQKYLAILGKKRKPWQIRAYREVGPPGSSQVSPKKKRKVSETDDEDDSSDEEEAEESEEVSDYSDEEKSAREDKLPEITSSTSRKGSSPGEKEEPLKLPPIHNKEETEDKKESKLDDYQKLEKAIEDGDSETVLDIIAKLAEHRAKLDKVVEKYNKNNRKELCDAVKPMFKGETQDALMALLLPKPQFDAMCLYNALKGVGTDEDVLVEILGSREGPEIVEIKKAYEKEYGNTLEDDIKTSTSGDNQKFLLRLCEADRDSAQEPIKKMTLNDTKNLLKCAKAKKWGADDDKFIEILSKRSHPQLKGMLTEYKKSAKCDLEDTLEKQLNGDFRDSTKTMIQLVRNRPKYYAQKLHDALHEEEDVNYEVLSRLLNTCDQAELKAVKAAYQKAFKSTIDDDVNAECSEEVKKLLLPALKEVGEAADEEKKKGKKRKPAKKQKEETEEKKNDATEENEEANDVQEEKDDDQNAEELHQAKYHGTVTPAANFDALKDVEFVRGALVYKDRDGVITRLTSRSNQQRQIIAKKFSIRYKQDLAKLLKSEFGANMEDAIDSLMLPPSVQDARTLHEAMKGMGTKEKDLIDIICCRGNKEIVAIKEAYQQEFDRDLESDVQNETSGDFADFLSMLLQANRSESSKVKEGDVEKDAKELLEAGENQLGTNEEVIAEILTSRSRTHLSAVFEEYQKIADRDFVESMMSEMSGDLLKAVIAVVCYMSEPTHYFAEIINQVLSDDKALTRFIASRSEIDMVEIKEAYQSCSNHDLCEDIQKKHKGTRRKILLGLIKEKEPSATKGSKTSKKKKGMSQKESAFHPTVNAAKHFSSSRDAELIRASLGVDKDAIIMMLASRSNKQRQEILQKYQSMYEKDLLEDLTNIFGSGSEQILKPLFTSPDVYEATSLKESMEGMGTDEDLLISSICFRNNEGITNLKETFQKASGKNLTDLVNSETSGDFRTLLMRLLEGKRDESDSFDQKMAVQDATALHEAGEQKKFGTDESKFIEIFASRSKASLKATFEEYKKIASCDIVDSLRGELSGNFEKAMVLLANSIQESPPKLFASYLHRVVDIPREFASCICTRAEIDMVEIKTAYQDEFKETLVEEITKRYSNDQMNLLLALIKEWKQGRKDIVQPPGKAAESKYHPTVPPAANFNALNDADSIHKTQSSAFDMDEVIILLVRRTVKQRKEIASKYKEKYEKDLVKSLQEELDMEPSLLQSLFDEPQDPVVQKLHKATKGAGTDEKLLIEVVCTKTNQQLEGIKKAYYEAFEEDLSEVVARETSGQFSDILLKILKLERNESPEVSMDDVNEDAKTLYKAGDKRWGTDEKEFVEIFATRSRPHLKAVFKEFKKIAKRDITESLRAEMSGDLLEALLLIVSVVDQGELTSVCADLNSKLTEKQDFTHLVVAHSEVDMVEIKEEYKKEYSKSLADDIKKNYEGDHMKILLGLIKEWKPFAKGLANYSKKEDKKQSAQYHPTVTSAVNFNPAKDADTLYNAKGKDVNVTIMLLATRTKEQRLKIKDEYEKKYSSNLLEDLSEQLKTKACNIEPLFLTHQAWLVHSLHDAMKGFGSDEKVLVDVLCIQDNKGVKALKSAYKEEHGKDLVEVVGDETSGDLKDFLLEILKAERRENQPASEKQAVSDARALYEAGEKKWGTDESKFIKILTTRSRTHLKQVFVEYKKVANRDLIDSLKDELTGDLEYALITLVTAIQKDTVSYSADYLKESLDNPKAFMGCISHRAEIDAVEIKEEYNKSFSTTLANDINEKFKGNFSKLLLAVIKEWKEQPKNPKKKGATKPRSNAKDDVGSQSAGEFHATVIPVKPFNPVKDTEVIRKAIGKDKNTLIDMLSSRTIEQRQTIVNKYKERYNKANLLKLLKEDFGGEFDDLLLGMFTKMVVYDAKVLHEALKGKNINEKTVYQILCQRDEEGLQNIKQEYKKAYGHPLSEKINEVFSGDLKTLLVELLKCERSDVQTVDQKMAENDAKGLHEIEENKSGVKIIGILTTRSVPQVKILLKEYTKLSNTDDLKSNLLDSENASQALVMLASFMKDPLPHSAKEIKKSMKEDTKYCQKLIARHSEIDMVEIKDIYQSLEPQAQMDEDIGDNFNDHMQSMMLALIKDPSAEAEKKGQKEYHATVTAVKDFNAKNDSDSLKNTNVSENGTDGMIALICSRTKEQRIKIKDEYLKKYSSDLLENLCTTLKVKEKYLKTLFSDTSSSKAKSLYEAMKGFGTDERVLINVLCVQNNESLKAIKHSYKKEFGKELSDVVSSETSGDFQNLLLKILQADRDENQASNTSKAKSDAKALYEAGVKKIGTDEQKFIDILVSRSRNHLQKTFDEYKKIANQEIEESIKKETSGDLLDCLLALVSSVRTDPEVYWSGILNQYINKPQELFECVTERSEIDMVEIKEEYKKSYNVMLADDIRKHYSGNTSKILLALIKEFSFSPKPPATKPAQRATKGRANKLSRSVSTPPPKADDDTSKSLFHGTVVAAKDFDVNKDVKAINSSIGKDKKAIILLLSSRSNEQRQAILAKYKETSKKDLVKALDEEFQVKPESFIASLFISPAASDVRILQEAMAGLGTKENILIDILCQRSDEVEVLYGIRKYAFQKVECVQKLKVQEIQEIKKQYKQAWNKSLSESIDNETSGDFGKLLQELLKCDRDESTVIDEKKVAADASGLYEAGEKKRGTDEDKFIETLASRSYPHLIEVFKEYDKLSDRGFEKALKDEFGGDIGNALSTIVSYTKDSIQHYVNKLRETVENEPNLFARLIVERCEIDMVELKELYQKTWQAGLSDDINKHFDEDLKSFLLALIKEWSPNEEEAQTELVDVPEVVYHATVVTSPNFNAGDDAKTIKEQLGKDKNSVVDIVTSRTKEQRQMISEEYQKQEKEDLPQKLIVEFGEDCKDMVCFLMQTSKSDVEKLHEAMEGLGTKENILIDVLCRRTVKEIALIKTKYKETYGKDLGEAVDKETSGDLNKLLIKLIGCTRVQTNTVDKKQVEKDAAELFEAGEKKVGTDESRFIDIFTTRSFAHLKLVFQHYKKISGKTIEETIHKEFSGDVETAFITLVSYANDPLTKHVMALNDTVKDNPLVFCQLVVERSELDMVEIKELYHKECLVTLADNIRKHYTKDVKNILLALIKEWSAEERKSEPTIPVQPPVTYHATVVSSPDFVAENDVNAIMNHLGNDKDSIVSILTSRSKMQRHEIAETYQKKGNQALEEKLVEEFGKESKDMFVLLMQSGESDAEMLHKAMKGIGTKEDVLINILCRRNEEQLTSIKSQFKNSYATELEEFVEKETSGDLQELLIKIIKCQREEKDVIYPSQVNQDANDLYQAGEKKSGTDESRFVNIFTSRGFAHLKMMFEEYRKVSGKTIEESLQKEFSGDIESAFMAIVSYVNDPIEHYVTKLNKTIKDDPDAFKKLVIDRSEVDMVEIKELYQKTYKESLADDIKKHYVEDVKNILLALIKEWVPEKQPTIPVDPPVVYHPTVVTAQNFAEEDDLATLKKHFGNDKDSIVTLLTTRTKLQRQTISELYHRKENQVLEQKLIQEFGKESEDILSLLMNASKSDAEKLNDAMKGFGTKEDVLINILCHRNNQEIMAIKTQYKSRFEKDLDAMIESETGGDLQALLLQILKCEREEKDALYPKQVEKDAADLRDAGEKKIGTDESKFIHIFTRRSFPHLKLVFEQYKKICGKTIEETVEKEFSGDVETAFKTLVSYVNDPLTSYVTKLNSSINKDPNVFYEHVVERSEVDMVEIKELYQKTFEVTLADDIKKHYTGNVKNILLALIKEWVPEKQPTIPVDPPVVYHPTVVTAQNFAEEDDLATLKKHFGNDEDSIVALLTTRTKLQRQTISELYHRKENQVLEQKLIQEFGKESEDILSLLMNASKSDAEKLNDAMKGFGTKEDVLINILCHRNNQEIMAIKTQYKSRIEKDLDAMIESETGGDLQALLLQILKCEREEKDVLYPKQVEKDAADLRDAGEKKIGTDESKFIDIFTRRSFPHLKLVFEQYKKICGKTIEETVEKEFSGDVETAFKTLVSYVNDPLTSHVTKLNSSIKNNPNVFCEHVVERSEVDMVEIKELYQKTFEVTLADDIKKHYTGNVKNILLALIKEWQPDKQELNVPPPVAYHATVRPSPKFDVDGDVNTLKQSLGNDKNAIVTILTTRTRNQRQEICEKYKMKFNEDLYPRLEAEFGNELSDTLSLLMRPLSVTDAEVLYGAMKGFGTKEDVLISVLCRRNHQEITAIKTQYKIAYENDLAEVVDGETSGDLNKLLVELIKCEREEEGTFNSSQVEKDASDLYKAGEKSWGTDESTFIAVFTKRSFLHLRAVFEHYKKISGNDIVNALNSELDGHLLTAFLALVSSARDPPTYYAGLAKQTVKESPKDFTRLIVERCEIDTVEIKDVYQRVYKKKFAEEILANYNGVQQRILLGLLEEPWEKLVDDSPPKVENNSGETQKPNMKTVDKPVYHGTINAAPAFNPKEYAEKLRKAMKGFGTDEKTIINVLSSRSNEQRRIIANTYQQEFNKDLLDELKSELGGDLENLVVATMLPSDVFYARELNKTMKGFGCDEEALLEIICSQTSESLLGVVNCYKKENGKDIKDAIDQETKGDIRFLLQSLLLSGYFNSNEVDLNEVESMASDIHKAGNNTWQGENAVFLNILKTKSRSFMVEVFKAFQNIANCDIVEAITKANSGTYKDLLIATVTCIRDPPSYFAKRLYSALDRMNVDDDTLIRCVVGRSEIDLLDIKQAFQKIFSVSLEDMIKKKCRGDYETMLVSIVQGN